jgi:hypothetical protein
MSEFFERIKSELFQGGAHDLRSVIHRHRSIEATPVEREFDEKWARELKSRILNGLAVSFHWAVAELTQNGRSTTLRMNGNHSSWALDDLLHAGGLPPNLAIHLDTYRVTNQQGAVVLFRQFDARQSSRTKEDISGAYQCFNEAIRGCKRRVAKLAIDGAAWYKREIQGLPVPTGDDVYSLFNETRLHPFVLLLDSALDNRCRELFRVPIAAAAYGTWLDDARRSAEFWRFAALGTRRNVEDAAADLDTELTRIRDSKEKAKPGELYAKCAKAWQAYVDGTRVASFRVNIRKGLPVIAA